MKPTPYAYRKAKPATQRVTGGELVSASITRAEASRTQYTRNIDAMKLIAVALGLPAACAHLIATDCSQSTLRLYRAAGRVTVRRGKGGRFAGEGRVVEPHELRKMRDPKRYGGHTAKATQRAMAEGDVVEVLEHPVLDLLNDPNDTMSCTDLEYLGVWSQLIAGEAFEAVSKDGLELWPLLPQYTNPIPADQDVGQLIAYYAYGREQTAIEPIPVEQVIHFKFRQNPRDPFHGYGPLHDCYDSARVLLANTEFDLDTIENGNVPAGILNLDRSVYPTAEAVRDFMREVSRQTAGAKGKSKIIGAVGASGTPFQSMTGVGKEMQTMERLDWHKGMVRRAFGVPETVLDNRSSAFASAEQGDDQYQAGTVRPLLWRRAEQRTRMLEWYDVEPGEMWFAYDDPVLADRKAEAEIAAIETAMGVPLNWYLAETGREPVKGGDIPRINGVPLDQVGQQPAMPGGPLFTLSLPENVEKSEISRDNSEVRADGLKGVDDDSGSDDGDGSGVAAVLEPGCGDRDGSGDVSRADDRKSAGVQPAQVRMAPHHAGPDPYTDCPSCSGLSTKDDDDDREAVDIPGDLIGAANAAKQTAALRAAMGELSEIAFDFIEDAKVDALRQIRAGQAIDLSELQESLAATLEPTFREMYRAGFDFAGLELDEGTDLDPFTVPNAEAVAEMQTSLVRQFSSDISDHTAQSIEARVRQGLDAGDSIDDIARDLEADHGFSRARSERIARTEVQRAANQGKLARYKEAGVETKYSVTAPGASSVHRVIEARASKGIPIGDPFVKAGETIRGTDGKSETFKRDHYAPPYRPNCRCSVQTRPNERASE